MVVEMFFSLPFFGTVCVDVFFIVFVLNIWQNSPKWILGFSALECFTTNLILSNTSWDIKVLCFFLSELVTVVLHVLYLFQLRGWRPRCPGRRCWCHPGAPPLLTSPPPPPLCGRSWRSCPARGQRPRCLRLWWGSPLGRALSAAPRPAGAGLGAAHPCAAAPRRADSHSQVPAWGGPRAVAGDLRGVGLEGAVLALLGSADSGSPSAPKESGSFLRLGARPHALGLGRHQRLRPPARTPFGGMWGAHRALCFALGRSQRPRLGPRLPASTEYTSKGSRPAPLVHLRRTLTGRPRPSSSLGPSCRACSGVLSDPLKRESALTRPKPAGCF